MPITVYRVQDADGRGPWRPGLSRQWIDGEAPAGRLTETVFELLPFTELRALPNDHAYGSACRSLAALLAWFLPSDRRKLKALGFYPVKIQIDAILAESETQALVARRRPFREGASRLNWPSEP